MYTGYLKTRSICKNGCIGRSVAPNRLGGCSMALSDAWSLSESRAAAPSTLGSTQAGCPDDLWATFQKCAKAQSQGRAAWWPQWESKTRAQRGIAVHTCEEGCVDVTMALQYPLLT